jgi:hypothetical protein
MAFKKAQQSNTGGKFLAYGLEGCGKSLFLCTFPNVAVADSETGQAFYEGKDIEIAGKKYNNLVFVDRTSDLDTIEEDLDALLDGEYDGQVETFGIDSETKFFGTMQIGAMEVEEERARKKGENPDTQTISMQQRGRMKLINLKLQQAKISLSAKGMHVVSIAQEVPKYKNGKNKQMEVVGEKPDMHNSAPFDYDVIIKFEKEKQADGTYKYFGTIEKDRTMVTNVGDRIENVTYDIWKSFFDSRKGLKTNDVNYAKDIEKSVEDMKDDAIKAEELVAEFKSIMKDLKDNNEAKVKINQKLKDMEISVKELALAQPSQLQELVDFVKAL